MRLSLKRKNEYTKQPQKTAEVNIMRLMLPSILGMLLCAVCLAGMTWAWFTATRDAAIEASSVATFGVKAQIESIGTKNVEGDEVRTYSIADNTEYSVKLTATGTAKGGYCAVTVDGETYYTEYMSNGDDLSFTVCSRDGEIEIDTSWNEMSHARAARLRNGAYIGEGEVPTPEDENKDNDSKDQVKAKPKDTEDSKPEQGNDNTPAQTDEPKETPAEPEDSSEAGE